MSPASPRQTPKQSAAAAAARVQATVAARVREERLRRRWTLQELARRARLSPPTVHAVESAASSSVDVLTRIADALSLNIDIELSDRRRRAVPAAHREDPVHSFMGEFEAGHLRPHGYPVSLDEPYQHYQFAGRADVVAWDLGVRALLHIENRTRFPDFQEMAGAYNAKRAYLGNVLAERLGIHRWASETHVLVGLWSAEVLHALRLRTPNAFAAWWAGEPPKAGRTSALVVLDPLAVGRQRVLVGISDAREVRARHHGYADVAQKLLRPRSG